MKKEMNNTKDNKNNHRTNSVTNDCMNPVII